MDNDQLTKKGMELCQKGQFLQAVEYFQVVIENDPNKEDAYLWLADTYERMGKSNMAKSTVYKLLSINPTNKNAIKKIKSLDKENYSDGIATPISTVKGFNRNNSTGYKVELGRGRAIDCDLYLRFDGGGEVLLNIEGTTATVIGCRGIKELCLPNMVQFNRLNYPITRIDDNAFSLWNGVKEIYLPDTIQEIGDKAFANSGLKHIDLPFSLKKIGNEAFYSCESLKDIVIPDSVVEIGKGCFSSCKYLESVSISTNVTVLKDGTFKLCESLKTIIIPDSIVEIGKDCFAYTNMETVNIPASVKEVKDGAFWNCGSVAVVFQGPPPKIDSSSFGSGTRVMIQEEFKEQYQESPYWSPMIKKFQRP
jgi:hypothetical protein